MRKVALYGGSFGPFHIGHEMAILYVLETGDVDEVWVTPCFKHNFGKDLAPFQHRFNMCQLGTQVFGHRVTVSDIEARMGDVSKTFETVKTLQSLGRPNAERSTRDTGPVAGARYVGIHSSNEVDVVSVENGRVLVHYHRYKDNAEFSIHEFTRVFEPKKEEIIISVVVGTDVASEIPSWHRGAELLETTPIITVPRGGYGSHSSGIVLPELSSKLIRSMLASGQSIDGMVSKRVLDYIQKHKLYLTSEEVAT